MWSSVTCQLCRRFCIAICKPKGSSSQMVLRKIRRYVAGDATQGAIICLVMAVTLNIPRKYPASADLLKQITGSFCSYYSCQINSLNLLTINCIGDQTKEYVHITKIVSSVYVSSAENILHLYVGWHFRKFENPPSVHGHLFCFHLPRIPKNRQSCHKPINLT